MSTKTMKDAMAFGAASALIASVVAIATAGPSSALPVLPNPAAVRAAASNQATVVHYYRHRYHRHGFYARPYRYPWWYDPYSYFNPYNYPYFYPYYYWYPYHWGMGWGWGR